MIISIIYMCGILDCTVHSGYSGHVYSGHFSWDKIHLVYFIQVGYSGHMDIVARKWWPKVATISGVHCIYKVYSALRI